MKKMQMNGKTYQRDFELLGDVEKVRWYEGNTEIYDQDELDKLEATYVGRLLELMSPVLPII